jgi:hypothetical protein
MIVYKCDFCEEIKVCIQKEIDRREYDICPACWNTLFAKLKGKGRAKESSDIILLPLPKETEDQEEKPMPGGLPTIWGESDRPN